MKDTTKYDDSVSPGLRAILQHARSSEYDNKLARLAREENRRGWIGGAIGAAMGIAGTAFFDLYVTAGEPVTNPAMLILAYVGAALMWAFFGSMYARKAF